MVDKKCGALSNCRARQMKGPYRGVAVYYGPEFERNGGNLREHPVTKIWNKL
jgi:hypothetical protein